VVDLWSKSQLLHINMMFLPTELFNVVCILVIKLKREYVFQICSKLGDLQREMIFVQLFWYNFCTTFSPILTLCFYSLSSFFSLSLLFLTNEKREQQSCLKDCTKMVVTISLLLFAKKVRRDSWMFKLHSCQGQG